jgi:P27 family predicted phage terminase small subunit
MRGMIILSRKRARKPAQLLKGKYSKKDLEERKQKDEEIAEQFTKEDLSKVPVYLNAYGTKYYQLLMKQLEHVSLLTDLDKPSLSNLAFIMGVLEESHTHVKNNGLLIQSNTGYKPNPHLRIIKDYTTLFMDLAKSLALTPEMRQHMQKLTEENTSQFASEDNVEFLNNILEGKFGNG